MLSNLFVRYALAVITTYVLAVICVSYLNVQSIIGLGVNVSFTETVGAVIHDLVGMMSLYLPIIAVALLIAFLVTRYLVTRVVAPTGFVYALAGFVALATAHIALKLIFEISAVAPTATSIGFLSQCLAGVVGGWMFYWLSQRNLAA